MLKVLSKSLLGLLILSAFWPATSLATIYRISATHSNIDPFDGVCSISEAVIAASINRAYNECPEGRLGGTDTIRLQANTTYTLTDELLVGFVSTISTGERLNINGADGVVLELSGTRLASVFAPNFLSIKDLTIRGGDGTGNTSTLEVIADNPDTPDDETVTLPDNSVNDGLGGALYVTGGVELVNVTVEGNVAALDGGVIYMDSPGSSAGRLALDKVEAFDNEATAGNGGVLAMAGTSDQVLLTVSTSLFRDNLAGGTGGAFYLDGTDVVANFENMTVTMNEATGGAGAFVLAGDQLLVMNAATIVENTSAGSGAFYVEDGSAAIVTNTIVAGNVNGDCDGPGFNNEGTVTDVTLVYAMVGVDALAQPCGSTALNSAAVLAGVTPAELLTDADSTLLTGTEACVTVGTCGPGDFGGDLPAYLPRPISPNTVLDQGAPRTDATCLATDVRGIARLVDDCDIGAVEYRVAVAKRDEARIIQGIPALVDVAENDLGDTTLDCGRIPANQECLEIIVEPTRPGATATPVIDNDGYVRVRYNPGSAFHGIDRFAYRINRNAFDRTIDGLDVEEFVSIQSEPATGLLLKTDINDESGSLPVYMLCLLAVAGWVRKQRLHARRAALQGSVLVLGLFALPVFASDIQVTIMDDISRGPSINDYSGDQSRRGDGFCSLREAIDSARDRTINLENACENGAIGRDVIKLPRGCVTLKPVDNLAPEETGELQVSGSLLTIEGAGPHVDSPISLADTLPLDICDPDSPNFTRGTIILADKEAVAGGTDPHRLITASSSLTLKGLTLAFGDAGTADGGALASNANVTISGVEFIGNRAHRGGAVFLSGAEQAATINKAYFFDNHSTNTASGVGGGGGGALANVAQDQELELNDVTFEANSANQQGGAADLGTIDQILMNNVTVTGNTSVNGAGGLDLQDARRITMNNMTIVNNTGGAGMPGGINLGNDQIVDGSDVRNLRMRNSIYADNSSEECSSGTARFDGSAYNLYQEDDLVPGYYPDTCIPVSPQPMDLNVTQDEFIPAGDVFTVLEAITARNVGDLNLYAPPSHGFIVAATVPPLSPAAAMIIDAGRPGSGGSSCTLQDVRGFSRDAGLACDRGAFEFQSATAIEDSGSNRRRTDRLVVVDVLANDLVDPAGVPPISIQQCSIDLDPSTVGIIDYSGSHMLNHDDDVGTPDIQVDYWVALRDDIETVCTALTCPLNINDEDDPDTSDDCVVVYDSDDQYFLGDTSDTLNYIFQDDAGSWSTEAPITVSVTNLAPRARPDKILSLPGKTQVIPVLSNDIDYDGTLITATLAIKTEPLYGEAKVTNGVITYVPDSAQAGFDDSFQYSVEDNDGAETTGTVTIEYKRKDVGGGQLLSGTSGSAHGLFLLMLLAGWWRRLRISQPR